MRYRRRSNISLTGSVRTTRLTVVGVKGPKVSRSMTYAQVANIATMTDGFMDGINISAVDLQSSIVGHMQNVSGTFQGEYNTSYIDFKLGFVEKFLKPLIQKDYDNLWRNYYNYEWIDRKLDSFRETAESDAFKDDIDLMKIIGEINL